MAVSSGWNNQALQAANIQAYMHLYEDLKDELAASDPPGY